jgi:hypothetical protein
MARYFFAWTPLVIVVATAVLLTIPYLALIAFMIVALAVLTTLVWAIVSVTYILGRAIPRRWLNRSAARPQTATVSSPVKRQNASL